MRRGEIWWVEFDERRLVVLLSEDGHPVPGDAGRRSSGTDISGLGVEVAVGVPEGLPFEGVLRFAFPWPGFTPCTWLTTLSRDDLIERQAQCPPPSSARSTTHCVPASKGRVDPGRGGQAQRIKVPSVGGLGRRRKNGRPR